MSAIKLHLDEDADSHALLNTLRHRGLDVTSSRERGLLRCLDEEQLMWANEQRRVVYSYNASDFCQLHSTFLQQGQRHSGIIVGDQQTVSVGEEVRRILKLSQARTAEDMENNLEFLSNWSRRSS